MRAVRWTIGVILGIVFVDVSLACAFALRVNETFLSSSFYIRELRQADVFNFFYDHLLPPILDDASNGLSARDRSKLSPVKAEAAMAIRQVFPPDWLEKQSEATLNAVVPYITGRTNAFSVNVPLRPQAEQAGAAAKRLAGDEPILDMLFDRVVARRLEEAFRDSSASTGLPFSAAVIEPHLREVLDDAWLESQVDASVDAILPYLIGDQEHFQARLTFADRKDSLRKEMSALGDNWDGSAFLIQNGLDPLLVSSIPAGGYPVGFGLAVQRGDVRNALASDASHDWLKGQARGVAQSVESYILGDIASLTLTIRLDDVKSQAAASIARDLDSRLGTTYPGLRQCTTEEASRLDARQIAVSGFTCRLSGVSYQQLKAAAGVDVSAQVAASIAAALPATISLDQAAFQTILGPAQLGSIEDTRKLFQGDVVFTDQDLKEQLAKSDYSPAAKLPFDSLSPQAKQQAIANSGRVQTLERLRGYLSGGLVFSDRDLRQRMSDGPGADAANLDSVRGILGQVQRFSFMFWLLPMLLLVTVGLIGGRSIPGKILWAASFVLVLSLLLIGIGGPGYKNLAREHIVVGVQESIGTASSQDPAWKGLLNGKIADMAVRAVDDFTSGIARDGYILLGVSVIGIGAGAWLLRTRRAPGKV